LIISFQLIFLFLLISFLQLKRGKIQNGVGFIMLAAADLEGNAEKPLQEWDLNT